MESINYRHRATARTLLNSGLAAVDPAAAVRQHLTWHRDGILATSDGWRHDLRTTRRALVIGAGKGTAPMAQAVEDLLGSRLDDGLIVVKDGHGAPLQRLPCREASHPVPDHRGAAAAHALADLLTGLHPQDLVIALWSGGASALLPAPRPGLSLDDKQATTRLLLGAGVPIHAVNTVRKHLSWLKGGQLARIAAPARILNLAVSDVIGDDLGTIGSGPCAPDPTSFHDALAIVRDAQLAAQVPPAVLALLERGAAGHEDDTPFPGDACFAHVHHTVVASNHHALAAITRDAQSHGWQVHRLPAPLAGEAAEAGQAFARTALALARDGRPTVLLAGGETTVTLGAHPGLGGRNQEFALAAAQALAGAPHPITVLAAGTDGNDGPTTAAGGMVDTTTWARALAHGHDPLRHLCTHDAHPLLEQLGDLLVTGPTRTNVMDVALAIIGPHP